MKIRAPDQSTFGKILGTLMAQNVEIGAVNARRLFMTTEHLPTQIQEKVVELGGQITGDTDYEPDFSDYVHQETPGRIWTKGHQARADWKASQGMPYWYRFNKTAQEMFVHASGDLVKVDPKHVFPRGSKVTVTMKPVEIKENEEFRVKIDPAMIEFRRAGGDCVCNRCGKTYREHPHDGAILYDGHPFLRKLCDGSLVKL